MWENIKAGLQESVFASATLLALAGCSGVGSIGQSPSSSPAITISGPSSVRVGSPTQYSVQISGLGNAETTWSVSGSGSNTSATTLGSVSSSGVYTPPSTPVAGQVTVTVRSVAEPSLSSSMSVQLLNPVPQITAATITSGPAFTYIVVISGSNFVPGATVTLGSLAIAPSSVSATGVTATISMASLQTTQVSVQVDNPDPGAASSNLANVPVPQQQATVSAAARLLDQATFGPTFSDIAHVQQVGLAGYLTEQFAVPASLMPDVSSAENSWPIGCGPFASCEVDGFWSQFAMLGQDQLRQRVAFALSKIWTVSYDSTPPEYFPYLLNTFASDAFSNWRNLMEDVTLSGAMGNYLNMANNLVQLPTDRANENYGRELMQIFSIGTSRINEDGTPQLDANGNQIPIYSQDQVEAFARAFTGWTYANDDCSTPQGPQVENGVNFMPGRMCPMVALDEYHDQGAKQLLNGITLPPGQTAKEDLEGALDNVFQDPDLPPFVSMLLIQNLVESQPSPAYVKRVASVFVDNGSGVRGDMKAIIRAILLDPEARAGDDPTAVPSGAGKLRDPNLFALTIARALNPMQIGDESAFKFFDTYVINGGVEPLHSAPNVFGFYSPSYAIPGTQLIGPEFQLETGPVIDDEIYFLDGYQLQNIIAPTISGASITLDLSSTGQLGTLASQGIGPFLDGINILFFHGNMSSQTRTIFTTALTGLPPVRMVRVGVYLAAVSPEFRISQ